MVVTAIVAFNPVHIATISTNLRTDLAEAKGVAIGMKRRISLAPKCASSRAAKEQIEQIASDCWGL